ncbi:hypothetical protein G5714_006200 [Onychostoma macrolepis]|uniref:Uncharacterized protein n=1 Tax=Onychostoma macrolepis TaxID=369639 RepID=A0A7J6D365_9TELE|nr:hypothetical protein G5714_006200 [Onychostoma macrolepis]
MLTSWMTAKCPDQTLPFRLYLFDTWVLCSLRASARASQPDNLPFHPAVGETDPVRLSEYWPPVKRQCRSWPPTYFLSDGQRGLAISRYGSRPPAEHRPPVSSILAPFPPAWRGLPVRCPESQSPIGCCESPPSSGFSLLPTRRRGYPSDIVVLISCQTLTLVSQWAPVLAARK